jgi:hypothetical protein
VEAKFGKDLYHSCGRSALDNFRRGHAWASAKSGLAVYLTEFKHQN